MAKLFKQPQLTYILLALGAVIIFALWYNRKSDEGYENAVEKIASAPYKFVMYFADWCPHCHTAKPEFEKLGATRTIGGKQVAMKALEEKQIPEGEKKNIQGYPTIQLYDAQGGLVKEFEGPRTKEGFEAFLNSALA